MPEPSNHPATPAAGNTERPLVTLVLLTYRQETFIREAVETALAQTYQPLEVILSDDCSPDSTFEIIESIVRDYRGPHRVVTNRNPANLGLGAHFQRAVELSHGEWIVAAAGDDTSEPQRVQRMVEAVSLEPGVVAAASSCRHIDAQGNPLPALHPKRLREGAIHRHGEYDWVDGFCRSGDTGVPGMSAMWHRSLFTNFAPMGPGIVAEDVVLGFRAYLTGTVVFIRDELMNHRFHDNNAAAFVSNDPAWMEDRQYRFAEILRPSMEMHHEAYERYLRDHPEVPRDPRIPKMLDHFLWLNHVDSTWWNHGFLWKFLTCAKLARTGGLKKLKRYIPRLLPKNVFLRF
jgi:glycosyltransferase involved in cell wall biosynthesis